MLHPRFQGQESPRIPGQFTTETVAQGQYARTPTEAAAFRQAERERKERERAAAAEAKYRQRRHLERRSAEVDAANALLEREIQELEGLLAAALSADAWVDIQRLKTPPEVEPFDPGELATDEPRPDPNDFRPPPLGTVKRFVPGAKEKHAAADAEARQSYQRAVDDWGRREAARLSNLDHASTAYDARLAAIVAETTRRDVEIDKFQEAFELGDAESIARYFELVLQASRYPQSFSRRFRLAYVPESRQLVIEFEFSPVSVIPPVKAHRYVKTKDEVTNALRPAAQIKTLYGSVVAQSTLRTLYETFQADRIGHLESVVFNGHLDTIDRATGKPIRPCLVTVRTTKQSFAELDLANVEPAACLRHLGAHVSRSPTELVAVRPVLEFDMVDKRFVDGTDVLSTLDQRPNLMELTPGEFETLITNLFAKMGLDTRQTQPSRDGGVDCVAFDARAILGGKVVIQAKRYKGTVGVSAVRDLFGTVHNEGASKGILVATSGYGRASYEFANGKPLELVDGSGLLYLLQEHAGIAARIEPPDDWVDPASAVLA